MTRPDPPRLLGQSDTPDALREALRGARGDLPSPDRLARLAGRLGPPFGDPSSGSSPTPPATTSPAPAAASLTSTVIAPALVSGALTLGLLGAVGLWPASSPAPAPPAPSARAALSVPSPVAPATAPASSGASIQTTTALRPTPPADPSSTTTSRSAAAPDLTAATGGDLSPPTPGATGELAPSMDAPYASSGEPPPTREPEASLLHRAREALASSPSTALDRVAEHERLYPGGVLTQEREVLAIEALVRQGRTADARARAGRFAAQFPRSAHLRRLQTLVPDL